MEPSQVTPACLYNHEDPDRNQFSNTQGMNEFRTNSSFPAEDITMPVVVEHQVRMYTFGDFFSKAYWKKMCSIPTLLLEFCSKDLSPSTQWILSPSAQWVLYLFGVMLFLFVIIPLIITPHFIFETVRVTSKLVIHLARITAQNTWLAIQFAVSRVQSLMSCVKKTWPFLQHKLHQVFDFCSERFQSSTHRGWLIPILVLGAMIEPKLIFSEIIPFIKTTCSEWISFLVSLMLSKSTTFTVWAKNTWTTLQSTMLYVPSLTGWVLGIVALTIITWTKYGWVSTQSLKTRVSSLTTMVCITSPNLATVWARSSQSAAGSVKESFTSWSLKAINLLQSWFHTQMLTSAYTNDSEIDNEEEWDTHDDGDDNPGLRYGNKRRDRYYTDL